uniref:Nuclear respiratory factor 1 NLS/DNA-binding dimerisation domain-containing protein n=1 Tax=Stomoxys calcitrans TaxID=35570 RepID=A0A1I8Q973_STOCA
MNVTTITTLPNATQAAVESITSHGHKQQQQTTYKIEMLDDSMASDDDDDDLISSDGSIFDENELAQIAVQDDLANQLAAAGPVGVAAAAAIASSKKRKRQHSFETNPSVRKRQQNRLLRKLRGIIYEFTGRVGKQAVVLVATPGKPNTSYKVFGAKPLEDVVRNLKNIVMDELENALAQQAPPPPQEDPSLFELPPLIIDGIPTPVEKMTQAQLRAFIPLMLKYSTGRGKPGWGREATRPPWWPKELPWANVRMDARSEDDKQKISWTHALRKIVINCYKYHGREDLLPTFADEDDKVSQLISHEEEDDEEEYTTQTVLSTIQNADGTVSLIQVDPNNPIITLPDGTTAQVQGVATLHQGEGGATIQTVQSLGDVNGHENMTVDLTEATVAQDGQIYITTEDGQGYPVSVSNMITVPVSASMYQSMMANIQQIHTNSDGTVCITPMQVDSHTSNSNSNSDSNNRHSPNEAGNGGGHSSSNSNNSAANNNTSSNSNNATIIAAGPHQQQYQCYSIMAASPLATTAAAAQRLLANSGLSQAHALVQSLSLNSNNNNNNNNSGSSSNSNNSDNSHNHNNHNNSNNGSSCNNNLISTNANNIRCQIINASSSLLANQNSSSHQQMATQQHHHHLQHHQHQQAAAAFINQQSLANVLQNGTAKVFIAANPAHLSLTAAAAANIFNSNNNNSDATATNNNNNNGSNSNIKIATALPIVVATTGNPHAHHQHYHQQATAAIIAAAGGVGAGAGVGLGKHRSRNSNSQHSAGGFAMKTSHKRRKHNNFAAKVLPIKIEEQDCNSAETDTSSLMHHNNNSNNNSGSGGGSGNIINTTTTQNAEGLLNIQILESSSERTLCHAEDGGVTADDADGVGGGADDNDDVGNHAGGGAVLGVCHVGNVRMGNRLLSVDVSKTIKLESIDS